MRFLKTLLCCALLSSVAWAAPTFPDISQAELEAAIKAKTVVILDCNGTESYKDSGHIPGAIDFEASEKKLAEVLPKDKKVLVVAYCGGPQCNAYKKGAQATQALGFTNVKHFSKGLSGWSSANLPLEK